MLLDHGDDKSTLVQVMAWWHQATGYYLSQCWPSSMSLFGVTRPQWVNALQVFISLIDFIQFNHKIHFNPWSRNIIIVIPCELPCHIHYQWWKPLKYQPFRILKYSLNMVHYLQNAWGWVGLWGFLWWAPSAKRKDHHGVSSGWSNVWHRSNTGLSSTQYEQIPIILGVWPFWLTPFFFGQ